MILFDTSSTSKVISDLFVPNPELLNNPPSNNTVSTKSGDFIRILFLDVDGVLNSHKTQIVYGGTPFPGFDSNNGYVDHAECTDLMAAELVNKVCASTGAVIVVSSSWRIGSTLSQLKTMMETLSINPDLIIGKTPALSGKRGFEIANFLERVGTEAGRKSLVDHGHLSEDVIFNKNAFVQSYAILDDDSDMLETQKDNFVQTTFMEGLTCALTIDVGQILSQDDAFYLNRLIGIPSAGAEWENRLK